MEYDEPVEEIYQYTYLEEQKPRESSSIWMG